MLNFIGIFEKGLLMRFIHLTDLHTSSPIEKTYFSKRALGLLSWKKRRYLRHNNQFLKLLIDNVKAEEPDLVIITGDIVQLGTEFEIQSAKDLLLEYFGSLPIMIVPGNHDNYARDSLGFLLRHWPEFLQISPDFPSIREFNDVILVGLMSAQPTPFWSARGDLGARQFVKLKRILAENKDKLICMFMHHPPYLEGVNHRKSLKMTKQLEQLLSYYQVALICHGHLHRNIEFDGLSPTRVFCTASASACLGDDLASYRIFDLSCGPKQSEISTTLKQLESNSFSLRTISEKSWTIDREFFD